VLELEVLVPDFHPSYSVITGGFVLEDMHVGQLLINCIGEVTYVLCVDSTEAVVAELVHQAIEHCGRAFPVHAELATLGVVVLLVDMGTLRRRPSNPHHPQEFVDI